MSYSARVYYEIWREGVQVESNVLHCTEKGGEMEAKDYLKRLHPNSIVKTRYLGVLPDTNRIQVSRNIWLEDCPECLERSSVIYHKGIGKKRCIVCDFENEKPFDIQNEDLPF